MTRENANSFPSQFVSNRRRMRIWRELLEERSVTVAEGQAVTPLLGRKELQFPPRVGKAWDQAKVLLSELMKVAAGHPDLL